MAHKARSTAQRTLPSPEPWATSRRARSAVDAALSQQAAVLVEVVAPVGVQAPGLAAEPPAQAPDRRDGVKQGRELGGVVAVTAGEGDGERGSVPVDDQVVPGAGAGAVDGRGADVIPPLRART
ncbi:hypothetical protein Slala05_81970 [Streptomyces lavendulae subsp. lavendulae]|nr:hypothetical protein Slala05_81970 [Streptomyces lavendulae subsp. lavendulae]